DAVNVVCNAKPLPAGVEVCNGRDDDCDGAADDGLVPVATSCGLGACAAVGVRTCVGGQEVDSCQPGLAADGDATCDARDDDCDGASDEDFLPMGTECGTGACAATGTLSCVGGQTVNSC